MKRALLVLLLAGCAMNPAVTSVSGVTESVSGVTEYGTKVTLFDAPCKNAVILDRIKEEHQASFRAGRAEYKDEIRGLCWRVAPDRGVVFVIDDMGEMGVVPLAAFGGTVL